MTFSFAIAIVRFFLPLLAHWITTSQNKKLMDEGEQLAMAKNIIMLQHSLGVSNSIMSSVWSMSEDEIDKELRS